jgi:hypothetical protein
MKRLIKVLGKEIRITGRLLRVAQLEGDGYLFLDDPEEMIEGLRACGERIDLFTFMQKLPETSPQYRFPMEWDNFAALPISSFDDWWNGQIRSVTRNRARQAAKRGVVVREVPFDDSLVKGIWEVYNEFPVRQGRRFEHFGETISTVCDEEATFLDHSVFIGAFLGEQLIGFCKLVFDETCTQAGTMNIISMIRHRDKAPTNALIAQAVRSCAERGIRYLVYCQFAYGTKEWSSLADFKSNNGFRRIDIPRYYVPLTPVGRAALRLGTHKRLWDRLPSSARSRLRDWRSAWYAWRYCSATRDSM